jgi:uncharacterized protein
MTNHHILHVIAKLLLLVGGLNLGLIGLFQFNLIGAVLGEMSAVTRILYVLIGLSAIYKIVHWIKDKRKR